MWHANHPCNVQAKVDALELRCSELKEWGHSNELRARESAQDIQTANSVMARLTVRDLLKHNQN